MVEYKAYRQGDADPNAIEMGMPHSKRIPSNQSTTTFSNSSEVYMKHEHSLDDEDPNELETDYQPFNWKRVFLSKKYLPMWIVLIIIGAGTAIITLKHDQVVEVLRPFAEKVRNIPAGWLIFVAILVIISFPPLFGHELVALLAGVVYGLWIGFGVVAAGTFIGEIGTWYAFKGLLRKKAEKMERTNLNYGAMAMMCRVGGFWMVFMIRLSIVPSHLSTAVFSTCDVKFWHFAVSTFFTLPKQLILVYLGVLLLGGKSSFWVKFGLFGVAGVITVASGVWIYWKMRAIKKDLVAKQELKRARLALRRDNSYYGSAAEMRNNNTAAAGGGAYAPQFEQEQADLYATNTYRRGNSQGGFVDSPLPPSTPSYEQQQQHAHEKAYRPYNEQPTTVPGSVYYADGHSAGGDVGVAYGQAYTTPEAAYPAISPVYQASVQDSPEQPLAHKPQAFV